MDRETAPTDPEREQALGRVALWLEPQDLLWLATREDWCNCTDETPPEERERCGRVRFRANAAAHKAGLYEEEEPWKHFWHRLARPGDDG